MFRNLILPACVAAMLALVAQNPAFTHDTVHKKVLAAAVIAVTALEMRLLIAARRSSRKKARARVPVMTYTAPAPARGRRGR